ncbi:MAG: LysR family transcriptional regulator [Anaerolineae bacterium]|nr:LysR family transcriptional regulator [Anaerolineae bacterium]MDW8173700.1 LysR family transcriptional regulator [Anaerolineae bacterium]
MLSLYKLEIFAAVVQEGSFSGAASRLYMTQPAVSQHIQDLEASLGTKLFDRRRRGVHLTPAGETLHDYTRKILRLVSDAQAAVTNVEQLAEGSLALSATPGVRTYLLPQWISGFRTRFPNLSASIRSDITPQVIADVLSHQADLGFVEGELNAAQDAIQSRILTEIRHLVIVAPQHPWFERETVAIQELQDQPFVTRQPGSRTRTWMDGVLGKRGVKPRIVGEFDDPETIKQSVMANIGLSILPDYAVRRELEANLLRGLIVEDCDLRRHLKLIWDGRQAISPIARAFLSYLAVPFPGLVDLT